jgi:acylphosphatase
MTKEYRKITFSGNVQGVGFRWTTRRISSSYKIYGYVKNLVDGKVELFCEGEKEELNLFLNKLRSELRYNIMNEKIISGAFTGRYNSFSITF